MYTASVSLLEELSMRLPDSTHVFNRSSVPCFVRQSSAVLAIENWKLEKCAKVSLGLRVVHRLRPVRRSQDAFHRDAATFPKRTNLFFSSRNISHKVPLFSMPSPTML